MGTITDSSESLNLRLLAMDCMKSSGCLMDGYSLCSLTLSAYILAADCTADTGVLCPSHFGEFESQSSVIHSAMPPGNSGKKKKKFCQTLFAC